MSLQGSFAIGSFLVESKARHSCRSRCNVSPNDTICVIQYKTHTRTHHFLFCSMSFPGSPWFDPGLPPPTYQHIMELVDRSVNDDADSRTAAVKLKRHRGEGSQRGSSRGSSKQSTPRKRMKFGHVGRQDIADFVPTGANFSASNLDTYMDHEAGHGKLDDAPEPAIQDPNNQFISTEEKPENEELRSANIRLDVPVAQRPGQIPSVGVIAPGLTPRMGNIAVRENCAYVQGMQT